MFVWLKGSRHDRFRPFGDAPGTPVRPPLNRKYEDRRPVERILDARESLVILVQKFRTPCSTIFRFVSIASTAYRDTLSYSKRVNGKTRVWQIMYERARENEVEILYVT